MSTEKTELEKSPAFPSVDDAKPSEEGGPTARTGFSYQDEVAVCFLIEMLESPALIKVHCETHDDLILVYDPGAPANRIAEYVQVKSDQLDKMWSVADLCAKRSPSIFEASLARDSHLEDSRFRIVTLRGVVSELQMLTFSIGSPGREKDGPRFEVLLAALDKKFPSIRSPKGNGSDFWLENCCWDVRNSIDDIHRHNLLRLMQLSAAQGHPLLPEFAEGLLSELLEWVKTAGRLKWEPDKAKKIITRGAVQEWWQRRTQELIDGATVASGGKLRLKMSQIGLPAEMIDLAVDLRRVYSGSVRTSRYMAADEAERWQGRVKSEAASLRAQFVAGNLELEGPGFHALCLERMDAINSDRPAGTDDRSAFLKGCLYDIADRCLLRFAKPT